MFCYAVLQRCLHKSRWERRKGRAEALWVNAVNKANLYVEWIVYVPRGSGVWGSEILTGKELQRSLCPKTFALQWIEDPLEWRFILKEELHTWTLIAMLISVPRAALLGSRWGGRERGKWKRDGGAGSRGQAFTSSALSYPSTLLGIQGLPAWGNHARKT